MHAEQRSRNGAASDRRWWRRENAYRDVWLLVITGMVAWALWAGYEDRVERTDQTCLLFERQHLREVRRLTGTYDYLVALTPEQRTDPLNRAILATLAEVEGDATSSVAPTYCDMPNVGLPEPNPRLPDRPPALR